MKSYKKVKLDCETLSEVLRLLEAYGTPVSYIFNGETITSDDSEDSAFIKVTGLSKRDYDRACKEEDLEIILNSSSDEYIAVIILINLAESRSVIHYVYEKQIKVYYYVPNIPFKDKTEALNRTLEEMECSKHKDPRKEKKLLSCHVY